MQGDKQNRAVELTADPVEPVAPVVFRLTRAHVPPAVVRVLVGHHGRQVVDVPVAAAITAADSEAAAVCTLRHVRHYRDVALQLLFE